MMKNAEVWDNFLEYIQLAQADWAAEEDDTDLYRMQRAVEFFNKGTCTPAPARLPPADFWSCHHLYRQQGRERHPRLEADVAVVGPPRDVLRGPTADPGAG